MLEFPEHGITRPKMLRITPQDAAPTDREFQMAVDIIIRAALHDLPIRRICDELESYASPGSGYGEEATKITEALLDMARIICPDPASTWYRLTSHLK